VIVWRDQAEHAAQSLSRGSQVVVVGRLQQRAWTAEDGSARSTVESAVSSTSDATVRDAGEACRVFRSVVSVLVRALGDFSLHPQGRPAGGLRPPSASSTRRAHARPTTGHSISRESCRTELSP